MIIGITTTLNESDNFQRVNVEYINRVAETGATPILITPVSKGAEANRALAHEVIGLVDGLLLTGGGDIHPKCYMNITMDHVRETLHPEVAEAQAAQETPYGRARRASDNASDCVHCPVDDAIRNAVDNIATEDERVILDGREVTASGGQNKIPCLDGLLAVSDARDALELELARLAFDRDVPTLGVCRGMQVLNVALGGTLYRDLRVCGITQMQHMQEKPYANAEERASVVPGTKLASILEGHQRGLINSIHHQGVNLLAAPLEVNAWGEDGIVEGVEAPNKPFFMGVQWHPEYLENHAPLFQALTDACA
ncbi:MAG: gamma-glutamyl-gamma-aminobutyrate hydrolase family protein [Eggerthellaceae bacterium]|nr:gamma-glutamyl-gamma-aminobutyrate hydrolase family protein [Eggerthellaceae bacterium]